MITDVVVVPGALLLLPEYQGRTPAVPGLRESCVAAVRDAVEKAAHVVVVHASDREPRSTRPAVGLRLADHLLAETHVGFSVEHVAVPWDASVAECVATGRTLAAAAAAGEATSHRVRSRGVFAPDGDATSPAAASPTDATARRTTMVVVADGSARRTEKAPGHLDPRAHEVDDLIVGAIRGAAQGGLDGLLDLDPVVCADLLVAGRSPLQVLAAALALHPHGGDGGGGADRAEGTHRDEGSVGERTASERFEVVSCEVSDPFGVLYVVAHLARTR